MGMPHTSSVQPGRVCLSLRGLEKLQGRGSLLKDLLWGMFIFRISINSGRLPKVFSERGHTVDGWNPIQTVEVGSLSHYLQGFIHPRWCRISSIHSSAAYFFLVVFLTKFIRRWEQEWHTWKRRLVFTWNKATSPGDMGMIYGPNTVSRFFKAKWNNISPT